MNEELRPMQVDTYRAIQAALKGYKVRHEKVPIIENIDNAKEAHATLVKIEITSDGYLKIYNNGEIMTEAQFANYSKFAVSDKNPGDQSGMFGEGAKLILGADFDVSVITISDDGTDFQSCYWENGKEGNRQVLITDSGDYRGPKAADMKIDKYGRAMANRLRTAEAGTTQYIKMPQANIDWIGRHVLETINDNYLSCILSGDLEIQFNNRKVEKPHDIVLHSVKNFKVTAENKEHRGSCEFYISDEVLDEESKLTNVVMTTYGKRVKTIRNETIEASLQDKLKGKVTCIVKCDSLSEFVTAAKEDFRTNPAVTAVQKKTADMFKTFIIDNDMNKGFSKSTKGVQASKNLMSSIFDKISSMGLTDILPSKVSHKIKMRSNTGKDTGKSVVRPAGVPGPSEIINDLVPLVPQQPRTQTGEKAGETSTYAEASEGLLQVKSHRQRQTGIPKIEFNNLGSSEETVIYNIDRDAFMLNLDKTPFKETFNKDKNQFNIHTRYIVFDWMMQNAITNGALDLTIVEILDFYKNFHQDSWL